MPSSKCEQVSTHAVFSTFKASLENGATLKGGHSVRRLSKNSCIPLNTNDGLGSQDDCHVHL